MKTRITIAMLIALTGTFIACNKDALTPTGTRIPVLPQETALYNEIPGGPAFFNPFGSIMVNNDKATLGRVLFYETQLSVNNRTSCGSCHHQQNAFADAGRLSKGFEDKMTSRNTPTIVNPGLQSSYFWDMREANLQQMVTQPIANHVEMGLEEPEYMAAKIAELPYYAELFAKAYGDNEITPTRIGEALSHFVGSMISCRSRYDEGVQNGFSNLTDLELAGKNLFEMQLPCAGCHGGENFAGWGSQAMNIGLEGDYADNGVEGTDWMTGQAMDGWFKVPSLRNVALTPPYMHDGRFNTLEEVVEFYNSGIVPHDQLAFNLREGWDGLPVEDTDPSAIGENGVTAMRLNLTDYQKSALVAFLKTLSDTELLADSKFSDPFVIQE
ncbi:MAG: cytochrome-c peroxidase [Flavobacteriales bacterium]|nr:cytochrome-c peroxidase [Flavobacteriales bacterium]